MGSLYTFASQNLALSGQTVSQGVRAFETVVVWDNPQYMGMIVVGLLLIMAELFVPGGILGTIGVIMILVAVFFSTESFIAFLVISLAILGTAALCLVALYKLLPKKYLNKTLILGTRLTREEGFSTSEMLDEYKGKEGTAISLLRPTGKVIIDNRILDAMAETGFISDGDCVVVMRTEGSKLIVRKGGGLEQ